MLRRKNLFCLFKKRYLAIFPHYLEQHRKKISERKQALNQSDYLFKCYERKVKKEERYTKNINSGTNFLSVLF